jgi:hypothetical protein
MNHVKNEWWILPETNTESAYWTVKSAILSCLLLTSINQLWAQDTIVTPKITPIKKESGIKHRLSFALWTKSNPVFSWAIGVQQDIPGTIIHKPYAGLELTLLSDDIKNILYTSANWIIWTQKEVKEGVNIFWELQGWVGFELKDELNKWQNELIPTIWVAWWINKVLWKNEIGLVGQRTRNILEKDWKNVFMFWVRFTRKVD